ncbi:homoserine kinase [Ponticaulis sp.]|uniref:homoserine kinase n=1 Tax=Ponticaulis sp. TaxID=2020902 RepID=UPI00262DE265|nr:homoserine kinase [Ponticaulis sp.]MDF1680993.1 homoserine kinase [Ponticaulis sp.]
MAVYTEVDDDALNDFLTRYDIGEAVAFKGIAEGVENSNYLLETTQARFILTLYEKRVNPDDLPFFMGVMEALSAANFPCPQPVKGKNGTALQTLLDKPAAIVTFLKGMSPRRPDANQCRQIGEAMARMHLALQTSSLGRPNNLSIDAWDELYDGRESVAATLAPNLATLISGDLERLHDQWPDPEALPRGIIHADLFPDNAFFLGEKFSGVIDFYFACTDMLSYDVAIALNAWCFEARGEFNMTKGRALMAGYDSVRSFTEAERKALPALIHGAAMRFFLTRLVDWTDTPADALVRPKNPVEYAEKLGFHRLARTVEDYGYMAG